MEPTDTAGDSLYLRGFDFVLCVHFRSKEEAKKIWMEGTDQDWSDILTENPLPESYEIEIDMNKLLPDKYDAFKSAVSQNIKNVSEVILPYIENKQ